MLYVGILIACVILGFAFSKGWIHAIKYRNLPPGSFGVPFIGETIQFADPHQFMQERIKKYGLIFKSHLLGKPSIIVCGKENVEWLIRQDNESLTQQYALPAAMITMLGEHNSANLPEDEWRWMRKHSAFATLSRETLVKSVPVIENLLHCHIREWEKLGNLKEWYTLLENFSFDVGSYFLWGDPSYSTERKKTIHHDFEMMGEAMMTAPINLPGTTWYKGLQARKRMVSSASKIISEIRQTGEYKDKGILGAWLSNLSDEEKLEEKVTDMFIGLLFAAHHTTTSALAYTVICLAQNPEVLQKVREEIAEIIPENEPLTFENLSKLRYLHMVQQEVLRLHSPANLIYRMLTKDVEYQGHVFPKGWLIIPNFISIHRDSKTFEEELKFDPERWNTGKPLYSFGAGIHQCLGRNIALLEGKMLVVLLARNYDWELPPQDLSYQQQAGGSKPKSGLHAILKRRVK